MPDLNTEPYDVVLYPSYVHKQTHPDRLAVIGSLMGMHPTPVSNCRVLELGCGDGANSIPMAASLRNSQFIGIDRAASAIEKGNQLVQKLGLKNISLQQLDLLELSEEFGDFDYIIAHGLYSWVPDQVKDKIMSICRSHLKSDGIAFISYNAYPGAHIADMLRNMILFHLRDVTEPKQRIIQGIAFLKFLAESQTKRNTYDALLNEEVKQTLDSELELFYHDRIGIINTPAYFFQFMNHAARHNLQFLGEADFFECQFEIYPAETVKLLQKMANESIILKEQYLDFLKCRRFRQTLLCRSEVELNQAGDAKQICNMYVASSAEPSEPVVDFGAGKVVEFVGRHGAKVATDFPLAKAALNHLARVYPRPLFFPALLAEARQLVGLNSEVEEKSDSDALSEILMKIYSTGTLEFYTRGPDYVTEVSERPMASPLARFQIQHDTVVTNLRHTSVEVGDDVGRQLLKLLDGTRDRQMLLEDLSLAVSSGGEFQDEKGTPVNDVTKLREILDKDLDGNLQKLAKLALLAR